jgi:hypothetical protein
MDLAALQGAMPFAKRVARVTQTQAVLAGA